MSPRCRVAVVDDLPLYRSGIIHALRSTDYIDVVGEGATADDAFRLATDVKPDVLLLDIEKGQSRPDAVSRIALASPDVRVVILTRGELEDDIDACLDAGVRGYVLKAASGDEIVRVVSCVRAGESYVTPHLAARLLSRNSRAKMRQFTDLSVREEAVLVHVARGLTNKEIARNLSVSEKTIKHHMTKLMQKLQVRSRIQAALYVRDRPVQI